MAFYRGTILLGKGNSLFALLPIFESEEMSGAYTVYATNIQTETDQTVVGKEVTESGVQVITVSASKPLILFDLNVSLEWDARQETAYIAQLKSNLERTSELLFDWTDGQMALGNITIYHNRAQWEDADVQILANNRYGPNADLGGLIAGTLTKTVMVDTNPVTVTYRAGQVRMGATWNRWGDSASDFDEDWSRAFTHELGHYLLYLGDNYYGFNDSGGVIDIDDCSGVMANPYIPSDGQGEDEFHSDAGWRNTCEETSSHHSVGRSDWATIKSFYGWVSVPVAHAEALTATIEGPDRYPLATTQIIGS